MPRTAISFILNDRDVTVDNAGASQTVLAFLRENRRLTGTKEGCAEGDCGACTVLVGRLHDGALRYEIVNACIRFLVSLDACHVVTIEHLRAPGGGLHPVQQAMVDFHGSQCGFCTPGVVMALYALWMQSPTPTRAEAERALQGNLCRCTGYAPILKAAEAMGNYGLTPDADPLTTERDRIRDRLTALASPERLTSGPAEDRAILPADVADLAQALSDHPEATIISGATDVGLWVTKSHRNISPAIFAGHLNELRRIEDRPEAITLGAAVSYTDAQEVLTAHYPHLAPYWDRIAGWQVRNAGTIGGNIANGSPIGDTPPALIALGARLHIRRGAQPREIALEDFFIDYGQQDLAPGAFVEAITIPKPAPGTIHAAYKISKRRDDDITAVALGLSITRQGDRITAARAAFGGMAATPKRAAAAEAALTDAPWSAATFDAAAEALASDFTPRDDLRASAAYRLLVAQNLLRRFFHEQSGTPVSLDAA